MKPQEWSKSPIVIGNSVSVVFTWQLQGAVEKYNGYKIGGPAVRLLPHLVPEENRCLENDGNWLSKHNTDATKTSIGCIRNCDFCVVKKIEPEFKELPNFEPKPILCDNNFLATSKKHIIKSIDKLVDIKHIDFNQGLDARSFRPWHIDQFKRLHWHKIRFAWDSPEQETPVMETINQLLKAGFPKTKIGCYVLIGFKETFVEAQWRCETLKRMGVLPNPMRYQPGDCLTKNSYVPPNWDPILLSRFMRYWSKQTYLYKVKFNDFLDSYKSKIKLTPTMK